MSNSKHFRIKKDYTSTANRGNANDNGQQSNIPLFPSKQSKSQTNIDIVNKLQNMPDQDRIAEEKREFAKNKFKELKRRFTFNGNENRKYNYMVNKEDPNNIEKNEGKTPGILEPNIFLWKYLAQKDEEFDEQGKLHTDQVKKNLNPKLKVWIPDTIVFNEPDMQPMWLYTNEEGEVWRTDIFQAKNIQQKLANFSSTNELVAVLKKGSNENGLVIGNDTKLLTSKELSLTSQHLTTDRTQRQVIQRYVKCIGSKAFIVRTCWSKNGSSNCFIITNKSSYYEYDNTPELQKYLVNPKVYGSCSIVETRNGKHLEETLPYLQNIVKYMHVYAKAKFSELVGDFVKDEAGIWWLINIKAFVLDYGVYSEDLKRITHNIDERIHINGKNRKGKRNVKQKKCYYCEEENNVDDLNNKLTLKMMLQMDKHLQHRGKTYDWLNRAEFKYLDTSNLYETHHVCKTCYLLYEKISELVSTYEEFSKYVGINMDIDKTGELVSITTLKKPPHE